MGSLAIPLTLLALAAVLMIAVIFIQTSAIKDYEELEELRQLFALQRTRMDEATELWRKETGQYYTLPDLGDLLHWLIERGSK